MKVTVFKALQMIGFEKVRQRTLVRDDITIVLSVGFEKKWIVSSPEWRQTFYSTRQLLHGLYTKGIICRDELEIIGEVLQEAKEELEYIDAGEQAKYLEQIKNKFRNEVILPYIRKRYGNSCPICGKTFSTPLQLYRHIRSSEHDWDEIIMEMIENS
ncbi:C2H2-type zinc finger protein [Candidatus Acidianus copahuensis]|nr:C2H2-type zinc finger protein [Candidatus Acidianus copahuensis]